MRFRLLPIVIAALILAGCGEPKAPPPPTVYSEAAIAASNRGVGLMGKFEYDAARQAFEAVVREHPGAPDAKVNLAIAIFNRQQPGDDMAALAILTEVLLADPHHLRAHYLAGLVLLDQAALAEAATHFQIVADADPSDAYAAYFLAQCLTMQDQSARALPYYRRAIAADPWLRSAYYAASQALARTQSTSEARELLARFEELGGNPRAHLAEFKYTRMGPRSEASVQAPVEPPSVASPAIATPSVAPSSAAPSSAAPSTQPIFAAPSTQPIFAAPVTIALLPGGAAGAGNRSPARAPSITTVDLDGDGILDLFIADAFDGGKAPNAVLMGQPDGGYRLDHSHPLARVVGVNAAAWGDIDNDGLVDVMLCRSEGDQWWRQLPGHRFVDMTAKSGIRSRPVVTRKSDPLRARGTIDCALVDADHDGDLDFIAVRADGTSALWSNNLDGTFRDLSAAIGFKDAVTAGARSVIAADLDGDRDLDLVLVGRDPPHGVFANDRLWKWHRPPGFDAFTATPAIAAVAGDVDGDGRTAIFVAAPTGAVARFAPDAKGSWTATDILPADASGNAKGNRTATEILPADASAATPALMQLALVDVNGDGVPDLVRTDAQGWSAWDVRGPRATLLYRAEAAGLRSWTPVLRHPQRGPSIVGVTDAGELIVWDPGPGRAGYATLALTGEQIIGNATRSNRSGIGARVSARIGSRWTMLSTLRNTSGPGQSLQPLSIGLGGAKTVDFVRIDWSDGVMQTELALAGDTVNRIGEIQRQLSSCPLLFAWNGREFVFVADALGAAAIGYPVSPGEQAPMRPFENLLVPANALAARDGRYVLRIAEPMEEVAYLDALRMVAWDIPDGWQMVLDERMADAGPAPTGEPRFFRTERVPQRVRNERGMDVTASLGDVDLVAAPMPASDTRFIGRLASDHVLTMDFALPLDAPAGTPMLVVDGWVEVPYAQTTLAAWQAHAAYRSPTLEAQDAAGAWRPLLVNFGYPAGTPRRMSIDLPKKFPAGTKRLRLTTNQEIYWDRISIAYVEALPDARATSLALASARVARAGFMATSAGPQKQPRYDYAKRAALADMHYPAGRYTAYGPADALVSEVDGAFAIIGPGDELQVEFAALPDALPGTHRSFVVEMRGYVKDMDLGTKDGDTVDPLPASPAPLVANRLHALYNTRVQAGE